MERLSPKRRLSLEDESLDGKDIQQFNFSPKSLNGSPQKIYHKFTPQVEGDETRDVKKSTIWVSKHATVLYAKNTNKLFGVTRDDLIGKPFSQLLSQPHSVLYENMILQVSKLTSLEDYTMYESVFDRTQNANRVMLERDLSRRNIVEGYNETTKTSFPMALHITTHRKQTTKESPVFIACIEALTTEFVVNLCDQNEILYTSDSVEEVLDFTVFGLYRKNVAELFPALTAQKLADLRNVDNQVFSENIMGYNKYGEKIPLRCFLKTLKVQEFRLVSLHMTRVFADMESAASIDQDGTILSCNSFFETLYGYSKEDVIGKSLANFLTKRSGVEDDVLISVPTTPLRRSSFGSVPDRAPKVNPRVSGSFPNLLSNFGPGSFTDSDVSVNITGSVDNLLNMYKPHSPEHSGHSLNNNNNASQLLLQELHSRETGPIYYFRQKTGHAVPVKLQLYSFPSTAESAFVTITRLDMENFWETKPIINNVVLSKAIAYGMTSIVWLGYEQTTVAIKVIDSKQHDRHLIASEIANLKAASGHSGIAKFVNTFSVSEFVHIVTEYVEGMNLKIFVEKKRIVSEMECLFIFTQIFSAVDHIHTCGIIHGDITLENILITPKGITKVIDFGSSVDTKGKQSVSMNVRNAFQYACPELLWGPQSVTTAVDIWSLGIVLYYLIVGRFPFANIRDQLEGKFPFVPHVSEECNALLCKLLEPRPYLRATKGDILSSPWFELLRIEALEML